MKNVFALALLLVPSLALGQMSTSIMTMVEDLQVVEEMPFMDEQGAGGGNTSTDKCTRNGYSKYIFQDEDRYRSHEWYPDGSRSKELTTSCKSKTRNARGVYTANLAPCTFKYHAIAGEDTVKDPYLSSACSDSNVVDEYKDDMKHDPIEEYVLSWPDECVGDYQRCYLVERDEKILLRHMCKHSLNLPGTTHVSVDCTADKKKKKEQNDKNRDQNALDPYTNSHLKHQQKQSREFYAVLVGLTMICLLSGCVCLLLVYRYGYTPYLKTLKRSK